MPRAIFLATVALGALIIAGGCHSSVNTVAARQPAPAVTVTPDASASPLATGMSPEEALLKDPNIPEVERRKRLIEMYKQRAAAIPTANRSH